MRGKKTDLTNREFNRLKVIEYVGNNSRGDSLWKCQCRCGNLTEVTAYRLTSGTTKSCGCLQKEKLAKRNFKHGGTYTRLYQIWHDMKERTENSNNKRWERYGGRGIKICKAWQDFKEFEKWALTNGYNDKLTIERIDNDKGYEPENCKWETVRKQNRNKSNNVIIEHKGERKTVADWAIEKGMTYDCLRYRLKRGWSIEKALETPIKGGNEKGYTPKRRKS